VTINGGLVMMSDDFPEFADGRSSTPEALGGSPVTIHLNLADVDAAWQRAVDAGATVTMPLEDQFWGDRYGQLTDPFGHRWSLATHQRDVTPEEIEAAMNASSPE
jgi:PhnB protein